MVTNLVCFLFNFNVNERTVLFFFLPHHHTTNKKTRKILKTSKSKQKLNKGWKVLQKKKSWNLLKMFSSSCYYIEKNFFFCLIYRLFGVNEQNLVTLRRVFQRCVQITLDSPEPILELFIQLERRYGMLFFEN